MVNLCKGARGRRVPAGSPLEGLWCRIVKQWNAQSTECGSRSPAVALLNRRHQIKHKSINSFTSFNLFYVLFKHFLLVNKTTCSPFKSNTCCFVMTQLFKKKTDKFGINCWLKMGRRIILKHYTSFVIYGVRLDHLSRAKTRRVTAWLSSQFPLFILISTLPFLASLETHCTKSKMKITRENVIAFLR